MNASAASISKVIGELEAYLGGLNSLRMRILVKHLIDRLRAIIYELSKADHVELNQRLSKLLRDLLVAIEALLHALDVYLRFLKGTRVEKDRAQNALSNAISAVEAALDAIEAALGLGPNPSATSP
ncbi:hypothetical protein [Xanthomonas sacchari]|uniref:hypothetical protein n=1 Tax=Xanthomonas sacchari TaxID=56458 RepID=UPI0022527580|nr:hypothetical protein [Xanthomonas sacchari]